MLRTMHPSTVLLSKLELCTVARDVFPSRPTIQPMVTLPLRVGFRVSSLLVTELDPSLSALDDFQDVAFLAKKPENSPFPRRTRAFFFRLLFDFRPPSRARPPRPVSILPMPWIRPNP